MAEIPSNSQRPQSFHPEFDREVYMIVFSVGVFIFLSRLLTLKLLTGKVGGQGFKVDAARLTSHSAFLREMLFESNGFLGKSLEGSVDNPTIVEGCTVEAFANFLGWLNHKCVMPLLLITLYLCT